MLPFAQLLTVRIGGVRIAGAAFLKARAAQASPRVPFPSTFHFKEISEWPARRKKNPNAPATASWMRPSTCSCPRGGQHHHGRHRRPRRRVQGCRLRPLQEQDRCLRRRGRPRAGRGRGADGSAPTARRWSPCTRRCCNTCASTRRGRCSACWKSCTTSASRATRTPLLRRRDIWERHALRNSEKLLRAAVRNEDLPGALDVRLSNVYLHSLIEGCSAASAGPIA